MFKQIRCRSWFFPILILMSIIIIADKLPAKEYRIAIVRDGNSQENDKIALIKSELNQMLSPNTKITFDISEKFNANWQDNQYKSVILAALQDSDIDMILGLGVLVIQEAAREELRLTKPFISATALNGHLPKLRYSKDDYSLKENLAVIVQTQDTGHDLRVFSNIWKFNRLHVYIGKEIYDNLDDLVPTFNEYSRSSGLEIIPVPIGMDVDTILAEPSDDVQASYLIATPRLTLEKRAQLIEGLNKKKIPTFSSLGPNDLELGALATIKSDIEQTIVRRTALNIYNLIDGASTKDLPVFLISDPKLQINARTAVSIGYSPNVEARVTATFLYPEAFEVDVESLQLADVISMAKKGNKDLFISWEQTEFAGKTKNIALSPMLPQLGLSGSYSYYDLLAVGIILPEQWMQLTIGLRQMIYDDLAISNYRASKRKYDAAKYLNESNMLNVYQSAAENFLRYSQARLIHEVQVSNLKLTEGNLDIAQMRVDVGTSGHDEVYRWQAELAGRKSAVLDAESLVEKSRISLNQVLGVDLSKRWKPQEESIDPESFAWLNGSFSDVFETDKSVRNFTFALRRYALKASPEINLLLREKEAQEIILGQWKRSYFLPSVNANLSYGRNPYYTPKELGLGDYQFQADVTASLPLFEGTRRIYEVQRQKARLNEIGYQLQKSEELIEKRLRSAVRNLEASFPNIKYSNVAAENARKNFEVVREKYASGIVNITRLLEAQTSTITAELRAVSAIYSFLIDLSELQRALAFIPQTKTYEEVDEFVKTIQGYMNEEEKNQSNEKN